MRVLYLSSWFPWPADTGGKVRILNVVKSFGENHDVALLALSRSGDVSPERVRGLSEHCKVMDPVVLPARVPIVGWALPDPRWRSRPMRASLQSVLANGCFDLVVASEVLAGYYGAVVQGLPRILDNYELSVLIERATSERRWPRRWQYRREWHRKSRFTRDLALQYDVATVATKLEMEHLVGLTGKPDRVLVVENGVDTGLYPQYEVPTQQYSLVYHGALRFHANLDAMRYFLNDILPLIRRRHPQACIRITGDSRRADLGGLPLGPTSGAVLTGFLEDVRPCVAASQVCVVPLRIGGGSRIKILEAMALGVPVVATSKGAEGLAVTHGQHLLIADRPMDFALAVDSLFTRADLGERLARNARRLVEERYDWRATTRTLVETGEELAHGRRLGR